MTDRWQEAITLAETVLRTGSPDRLRIRALTRELRGDTRLLRHPGIGKDVAHLAGLLEALGLVDEARALLEQVAFRLVIDPEALSLPARVRNQLAVALADRDYLTAAVTVLSTAVGPGAHDPGANGTAGPVPDGVEAQTLANLAALKLRLGDLTGAEGDARRVLPGFDSHDHASAEQLDVRLLTESVLAEVARRQGDHFSADQLVNALARTARQVVRRRGGDHPASLSALVALARAELASAFAAGDEERLEKSADVLEIAAQKTAATLGPQHPLSRSALLNLAAAERAAPEVTGGQTHVEAAEALIRARQEPTAPPDTRTFEWTPLRLPRAVRGLKNLPPEVRLYGRVDLQKLASEMDDARGAAQEFVGVLAEAVVRNPPGSRVVLRVLVRKVVKDLVQGSAVAPDRDFVRRQGLDQVVEYGRNLGRQLSFVRNHSLDMIGKLLQAATLVSDRNRARVLDLANSLVRALDRDLALELVRTLDADLAADLVRAFDSGLDAEEVLDRIHDLDYHGVLDRTRIRTLDLAQALADAELEVRELADDFEGADVSGVGNLEVDTLGGLRWNEETRWPSRWAEDIRRSSIETSPGVFVVDETLLGDVVRTSGTGL
ncbi:hypothetical protein [Streptomyces sp. MBT53]|uniref:hypothetical protein n=1 Tax=Streptomyces sp. MBT53 TaxID=1488384 RepID=UPI00191309FF|nr:hypothetical protein [Streptomyces sp. MBT53]MBK6018709.1 hypothetical protein [Streptomyces sp. MBT53]